MSSYRLSKKLVDLVFHLTNILDNNVATLKKEIEETRLENGQLCDKIKEDNEGAIKAGFY